MSINFLKGEEQMIYSVDARGGANLYVADAGAVPITLREPSGNGKSCGTGISYDRNNDRLAETSRDALARTLAKSGIAVDRFSSAVTGFPFFASSAFGSHWSQFEQWSRDHVILSHNEGMVAHDAQIGQDYTFWIAV